MYTKRVQIVNYGPIDRLDITLPFEGDSPKPVLLVGENGSGKSILLSHIVNGLVSAKGVAYPETPEVETGKVYKLRSSSYVKTGSEYYFARIEFEDGLFVTEMRSRRQKQEYEALPPGLSEPDIQDAWNKISPDENDYIDSSFSLDNRGGIEELFAKNCVLYFPHNRFEEPAWLNEENLKAQAQYMNLRRMQGYTSRKLIEHSPLHDNQNWLFDLLYDRAVLEFETRRMNFPVASSTDPIPLPVFLGYFGDAARAYETILQIVRIITRRQDVRFGIGRRRNRMVSLTSDVTGQIVPNIFQLSSGETSLLNLFLSILRDFDLSGTPFSQASDLRGIVLVDEIDLHLHAVHQHEVLPALIRMFPNVQFVITTHSPLFVLGMQRVFGEDGFGLYRLPQGNQISPEEFSEFGDAYRAFAETVSFSNDMRAAIEGAQKPIAFVEGTTGQKYIHRASQLLGQESILEKVELRDGGGTGDLKRIWKSWLPDLVPQKVMLLFDCEEQLSPGDKGNLLRRTIPLQSSSPIHKGIENLFGKETLERARQYRSEFIDVDPEYTRTVRGELQLVPEKWAVNVDEKTNLCGWLCDNGTQEDFQDFQVVFEVLKDLLVPQSDPQQEMSVGQISEPEGLPDGNSTADLGESS